MKMICRYTILPVDVEETLAAMHALADDGDVVQVDEHGVVTVDRDWYDVPAAAPVGDVVIGDTLITSMIPHSHGVSLYLGQGGQGDGDIPSDSVWLSAPFASDGASPPDMLCLNTCERCAELNAHPHTPQSREHEPCRVTITSLDGPHDGDFDLMEGTVTVRQVLDALSGRRAVATFVGDGFRLMLLLTNGAEIPLAFRSWDTNWVEGACYDCHHVGCQTNTGEPVEMLGYR